MALITADMVKPYIGILTADIRSDTQLDAWIAQLGVEIASFLDQPLELTTWTAYPFNGNGTKEVTLGYFPMSALTALSYRTGFGSAATWTAAESTQYELTQNTILYEGGFTPGRFNWRATFSIGYSTIPADVQTVCAEIIALRAKSSDLAGVGEGSLGKSTSSTAHDGIVETTQFREQILRHKEVLQRYARINTQ